MRGASCGPLHRNESSLQLLLQLFSLMYGSFFVPSTPPHPTPLRDRSIGSDLLLLVRARLFWQRTMQKCGREKGASPTSLSGGAIKSPSATLTLERGEEEEAWKTHFLRLTQVKPDALHFAS